MEREKSPSWFYILRLTSGKLYCGSTRNHERRYAEHFSGAGCRTTKVDPPVEVAYEEQFPTYPAALRRERQIKRWTRAKKEALISGDLNALHQLARRRRKEILQ